MRSEEPCCWRDANCQEFRRIRGLQNSLWKDWKGYLLNLEKRKGCVITAFQVIKSCNQDRERSWMQQEDWKFVTFKVIKHQSRLSRDVEEYSSWESFENRVDKLSVFLYWKLIELNKLNLPQLVFLWLVYYSAFLSSMRRNREQVLGEDSVCHYGEVSF